MDRFVEQHLPHLLNLLYDSALDASRWPEFFTGVSSTFADASGVLYSVGGKEGADDLNFFFGGDPAFAQSYFDHYAALNPYSLSTLSFPLQKVVPATHVVGLDTVLKSAFYNEWMVPQGIPADHLGVLLGKDEFGGTCFGVNPQEKSFRKNPEQYARMLSLLAPHLWRALRISRTLGLNSLSRDAFAGGLDGLGLPAFVLDANARILAVNALGEQVLSAGQVLTSNRNGELKAAANPVNDKLTAAIKSAAAGALTAPLPLRLEVGDPPCVRVGWIMSVGRNLDQAKGPLARLGEHWGSFGAAFLVLTESALDSDIPAELIEAVFGLSAAEARLVKALIDGRTLQEHAATSGVTINTVRSQLYSVFAKTGATRQSQLVAMVLRVIPRRPPLGRRPHCGQR